MKSPKSLAGSAFRSMADQLHRIGVRPSALRDSRMKMSGILFGWGATDPKALPGAIFEHEIDGVPVRFFVNNADDVIQQFHAAGKWFDLPELETISRHYRGGTFVDVGANVGNHSLYAAIALKAPKVIAFEPTEISHQICRYNVLLNDLQATIFVNQFGLSDALEAVQIERSVPRNSGATRLLASATGDLILKPGDSVLGDEQIGFMKIDVEGAELKALAGLKDVIAKNRPAMLVEVDDENAGQFDRFCTDNNYTAVDTVRRETNSNIIVVANEKLTQHAL
ncbi:MAG TPA: FkbM family methyltransferase [Sphingomicrobium sp.]|nr:FkbM family methyltransferase [Sphingomicrobium sp.]